MLYVVIALSLMRFFDSGEMYNNGLPLVVYIAPFTTLIGMPPPR